MRTHILFVFLLFLFLRLDAQNVDIPDANFKSFLLAEATINTNGDAEIQVSEANGYTGAIECWSLSISDLTGIEAFTSLTELYCQWNSISTLDLSQNTALTALSFGQNDIDVIDFSQNALLTYVDCAYNNLTTLDISQNSAITTFLCYGNTLTSLNVANSNNTNFISFDATKNAELMCIQVDDSAYSETYWPNLDSWASYSLDCGAAVAIENIDYAPIKIYPNPASDIVHVLSPNMTSSIKLLDLDGEVIISFSMKSSSLDLSSTERGLYFLEIISDGKRSIEKVILQ